MKVAASNLFRDRLPDSLLDFLPDFQPAVTSAGMTDGTLSGVPTRTSVSAPGMDLAAGAER